MKLHGLLRERNVCEVVASLKEIQPGLREVGSFLATFQVLGIAVGKPLLWAMSPSYVPDNVRYRPPEPTVDRALEQLRETLCGEQAEIQIDSDGESGDSDNYVVAIETIGTYTIDQLDAMTWLWNFAGHVSSRCCVRYKNNTTVITSQLKKQSRKKPVNVEAILPEKIRLEVCEGIAVWQFVLLPVNFDGVHWGCLMIDGTSKTMMLYDSMYITKNVKRLKAITTEMESVLLET
ncbi:hypothetical protein L915_14990 [Phytophthora nicotianae]|nr:hypothetical protein L915_14990 [Phytophthora nicotianae]